MRRWLVVIEDPKSVFSTPGELHAYMVALFTDTPLVDMVARVQRGGLLADKVMEELPPVRHKDQGVYR